MSDPELSPEEEQEISRLLVDAASSAPMPGDVAARLDDVLADLVAERAEESNVVPLRSRRWPKVLVAAAAVSLFGYVGTNVVQQSADDAGSMAERDTAASLDDAGSDDEGSPELAPQQPSGEAGTGAPNVPKSNDPDEVSGRLARLSAALFAEQIAYNSALRDAVANDFAWAAKSCTLPKTLSRSTAAADVYDLRLTKRSRGFMLVQPVNSNAARVDIYSCKRPLLPISSTFLLAAR